MKRGLGRLKNSRIGDFYEEAAQPIARFGVLVGRAIEAQASIACVNTVLTLIGLLLLDIPLIAMLSVIVFVCSFIPVLGVFISTMPIVLVALNAGGFSLSLAAIGLVIVVHAIESYLLNPMIYSQHLKLNPVLTLIILYVGYHVFGLWGMLLGVPVARYFIHDVLGVPFRDRGAPVK
jgi:predicted PurR-regulated permease PerM